MNRKREVNRVTAWILRNSAVISAVTLRHCQLRGILLEMVKVMLQIPIGKMVQGKFVLQKSQFHHGNDAKRKYGFHNNHTSRLKLLTSNIGLCLKNKVMSNKPFLEQSRH
ncbi:hypothetical protein Pint_14039 [Pistacia integerrima]|uniref:Uncharacterized protein n=1 Tax=Pistacia integerrima TaxID=434235 RepID=A0ACC0Y5A4_9ROSI|nr:hypothetical protein Pint_14039 [Pistacia integerrima]